jgi:flagellar assembly protein FliH
MKPLRETIRLVQPLKDAVLARCGDRESFRTTDLQASYERGRLDGERALSEQLIRQRAEVMELQTGVLTSLRQAIPQVAREAERTLVALAIEAAGKIVCGLPVSAEMIEGAVKEAIAQVEDTAGFTVQLHPEDLALLERTNSPLLLPQGGDERMRFQPSAHVTRGGCLVQTRFGVIDAQRETKVELLRNALTS